jgi:hypothetical protein
MAKRIAQKRKRSASSAASRQTTKAFRASHATALERSDLLILLGLAAMTLAIYAQVIGHQFFYIDDGLYIKDNPVVNRGVTLAGIAWAFTTFHAANWHPLTWIRRRFVIKGERFSSSSPILALRFVPRAYRSFVWTTISTLRFGCCRAISASKMGCGASNGTVRGETTNFIWP